MLWHKGNLDLPASNGRKRYPLPSSRVASNLSTMDTIWIPFGLQSDRLKDKALAICFLIFLNMWVFILARNSRHMIGSTGRQHSNSMNTRQPDPGISTARCIRSLATGDLWPMWFEVWIFPLPGNSSWLLSSSYSRSVLRWAHLFFGSMLSMPSMLLASAKLFCLQSPPWRERLANP